MKPTVGKMVLSIAAVVVFAASSSPVGAIPTCPDPATRLTCNGRIVPEPMNTTSFLQFDGATENFKAVLEAIEAEAPDIIEVGTLESWLNDAGYRSAGGRDVFAVRITDESVPQAGKRQVAISLSVHGNESAGREGGVRYIEDLTIAHADPTSTLRAGANTYPLSDVLAATETWILFGNPDGWAAGDAGGTIFARANDNGADLNRDLATIGWFDYTGGRGLAESEPEMAGWSELMRSFPNLATAVDLHGELTSTNNAFSDLIYSAGQWDPRKQAQVAQFAKDMILNVESEFAEQGVVLADVFGPLSGIPGTPPDVPTSPANVATAYDIVGYDDSGFMGDYMGSLNNNRVIEIDVENFLSHTVPSNVWVGPLEQVHIAAVYGNIETAITGAMYLPEVGPTVPDLGRIGYVFDPEIVTHTDGTESAIDPADTQDPYAVTRMLYFEHLAAQTGESFTRLTPSELLSQDLTSFDSIVVSDMALSPANPDGTTVNEATYLATLKQFATDGGQLVLTDQSVQMLAGLGVVAPSDVVMSRSNAGHVDFDPAQTDPWKAGLFGKPSQTYYEVPLGFPATDSAAHYAIKEAAWSAIGGTTVGTVNSDSALGRAPLGEGQIAIFGAILPQPIESLPGQPTPHPRGLVNYAVTIAGGTVFHNILTFERDEIPDPTVSEFPILPTLIALGSAGSLAAFLYRRRNPSSTAALGNLK